MSSKWKAAACVLGIVGLVAVVGAVHHHMARYGHRSGGQSMSIADQTGITATGYAEVKQGANQPTTVQLRLTQRATADDLEAKVAQFQEQLTQVKAGLAKSGISADAVQTTNFSISYMGSMPAMKDLESDYDPTIDRPDSFVKQYSITATLLVTSNTPDQMVAVMKAAADAGATTVDTSYKYGPRGNFFDTAALQPAVAKATEQAKALATAQAAASGVRLGALRHIEVHQPDYYAGPNEAYRVMVSVTYDIATATTK